MAHQLVGQRAAHSLEEERVVRVLEHAAVSLLLDVLQVLARRPARRILLAHVAEPAGELRQPLAVGALSQPVHGQVLGLRERRAREESDARFCMQDISWTRAVSYPTPVDERQARRLSRMKTIRDQRRESSTPLVRLHQSSRRGEG